MRDRSREGSREKRFLTTGGTGKLHVSNLALHVQEQEIKEEFERYYQNARLFGPVQDVKIIRKNNQGMAFKEFNYGFVQMYNPQQAGAALQTFAQRTMKTWVVSTLNQKA